MRSQGQRTAAGAVALGGTATVAALLPGFLIGGLAVQITEDLAFGAAGIGLAVAAYRASGAAAAPYLGRLADRLGVTRSLYVSSAIAIVAAVGLAATAVGLYSLMAWLAFAACANALAQPSSNRLIVRQVRPDRRGLAFGLKQSAPPAASMLAGLSVPAVALTIGWRWAFALGAVLAVGVIIGTSRRPPPPPGSRGPVTPPKPLREDRRILLVLAASFGCATAASSPVAAFYVTAAVQAGSAPRTAGFVLAAASLTAILVRIVSGAACDRIDSGHLRLCAGLVAVGGLGLGLLATGHPTAMTIGALVALGGGWGFNGVFWFTMMRAFPDAPGTVTGVLHPGGLLGATVAPITFGLLAERVGFQLSWTALLVLAGLAVLGMAHSARRLLLR